MNFHFPLLFFRTAFLIISIPICQINCSQATFAELSLIYFVIFHNLQKFSFFVKLQGLITFNFLNCG